MATVIHHGGAGTTATTAICGAPQIIVPHILDQFHWGERIFRSGLGPPPVWRTRLTAGKLESAIRAYVSNPGVKRNARIAADRIRMENGAEVAAREIIRSLEPQSLRRYNFKRHLWNRR